MGFRKSTSFYNDLILQKQIPALSMDSMSDTVSRCQRYKKMFCHCKYSVYIDCWPSVWLCFKTFPQGFSVSDSVIVRECTVHLPCPLITLDESNSSSKTVCHEGPCATASQSGLYGTFGEKSLYNFIQSSFGSKASERTLCLLQMLVLFLKAFLKSAFFFLNSKLYGLKMLQ